MLSRFSLALLVALVTAQHAAAFEAFPLKEAKGKDAEVAQPPCLMPYNTDGTAANYRWYNLCSGYIWIYRDMGGESVGVLFGGVAQPEIQGGNMVKRAITYYRNVGFAYLVDVYLHVDDEGDGCPDAILDSDINLAPGLRWNCSNFNVAIPCDVENLVLRTRPHPAGSPPYMDGVVSLATDGPYTAGCDPNSPARSFYYGVNQQVCMPWLGPNGQADNFLYWLVVDSAEPCPPNVAESRSWGAIKGLFR